MPLRLLDLPVEILEHILSPFLAQKQNPIALCTCGKSPASLYVRPLRILLIHPVIYGIAVRLFYAANTFLIDLDGDHVYHLSLLRSMQCGERFPYSSFNYTALYGPRKQKFLGTEAAVRRIRRVDVSTCRPKYFDETLLPLLVEMLLNGALTELHIRIIFGFNARIRIFMLPQFVKLLTIMGNPKLLTSQLWVSNDADHWLLWEPFRMRPSVGACEAREEAVGSPYGDLVEIDWRSILRTIDPEAGDKAIMVG
ncbi:hypothetical protein E4U52_005969 [Claviceps spartinae]|nr:hypothetical protein E4U52_005969 [Claviceps spartinae]